MTYEYDDVTRPPPLSIQQEKRSLSCMQSKICVYIMNRLVKVSSIKVTMYEEKHTKMIETIYT